MLKYCAAQSRHNKYLIHFFATLCFVYINIISSSLPTLYHHCWQYFSNADIIPSLQKLPFICPSNISSATCPEDSDVCSWLPELWLPETFCFNVTMIAGTGAARADGIQSVNISLNFYYERRSFYLSWSGEDIQGVWSWKEDMEVIIQQ